MFVKKNKWTSVLCVAFYIISCMLLGVYVRLHTLIVWNKNRTFYYYNDRPMFTSYDGMLYARYSRELSIGKYNRLDELRNAPGKGYRPYPPPLISVIESKLSKYFGVYPENIDVFLTPIFAVFFVIPLFLFFKLVVESELSALFGSMIGVLSYIYLIRTTVVRFDTDSLNLFFITSICFALNVVIFKRSWLSKLIFVCLALILSFLFWAWYRHPFIIISIFYFYVLCEFFCFILEYIRYREFSFNRLGVLLLCFLLFFVFAKLVDIRVNYIKPDVLCKIVLNRIASFYKKRALPLNFPDPLISVSETVKIDPIKLAKIICGNIYVFLIGVIGYALLVFSKRERVVMTVPMLFLGLLSFKLGNRFAIFLSPLVGVGFGFIVEKLIKKLKDLKIKKLSVTHTVLLCCIVFVLYSNKSSFSYTAFPRVPPRLVSGLLKVKQVIPEKSWIWSWWNYGYAIQYYTERATFLDGGNFRRIKTYFVAASFSVDDQVRMSNIIKTIACSNEKIVYYLRKKKISGNKIVEAISSGRYVCKRPKRPIYVMFTYDMIFKFGWIYYYGTWDFKRKIGKKASLRPIKCVIKKDYAKCDVGYINFRKGLFLTENEKLKMRKFYLNIDGVLIGRRYFDDGEVCVLGRKIGDKFMLFLADHGVCESNFVQMFLLGMFDKRHFKLVFDDFPFLVVYKVL